MVDSVGTDGVSGVQRGGNQPKNVRELGGLKGAFQAMVEAGRAKPADFKIAPMGKLDVLGWERAVILGAEAFESGLPAQDFLQKTSAIAAGLDNVRTGQLRSAPVMPQG